jgi:hypothetical protein
MAKFLKVVSVKPATPEVLIGIDKIIRVAVGDYEGEDPEEFVTIFFEGGTCALTLEFTGVEHAVALLKSVNAALTANPGGIVSTVNMPLVTPQTVVPATSGRQLITAPAVYQYIGSADFA